MVEALAWLMGSDADAHRQAVLARAWRLGLTPGSSRFSEHAFEGAIRRAGRRRPPTGVEICGLGELGARCHAQVVEGVADLFRSMGRRFRAETVLEPASGSLALQPRRRTTGRERLATAAVNAAGLREAASLLDFSRSDGKAGWGFPMALRITLRLDPAGTMTWLGANWTVAMARPAVAAVVGAFRGETDAGPLLAAALRSPQGHIRNLACVWLAQQEGLEGTHRVRDRLKAAGFDPVTAHWVSAWALGEAALDVHRLEERLQHARTERGQIARRPNRYIGGVAQVLDRLNALDEEIPKLAAELSGLEARRASALDHLAKTWPDAHLDDDAWAQWTATLGTQGDDWVRIAERMTKVRPRVAILDRAIDRFRTEIGMTRTYAPMEDIPARLTGSSDHSAPAAAALILKCEVQGKALARETGLLIEGLAKGTAGYLDRPLAYGRDPEGWRSAVARLALGLGFVFDVVRLAPPSHQSGFEILLRHARGYTELLLERIALNGSSIAHVDTLALRAVLAMRGFSRQDYRAVWATGDRFTPFTRALARWSDAEAIRADPDHSIELFLAGVRPQLFDHPKWEGAQRLIAAFDVASSVARGDGGRDLLDLLNDLWTRSRDHPYLIANGVEQIELLLGAASRTAEAEAAVRYEPLFAHRVMRMVL